MSEHRDTITVSDAIMKESFKVAKEALHAADACDCDLCAADAQMAIARALISAEARGMERAAKSQWQPIETAPLNKAVDLWCVEHDAPATWGNGDPAGEIVRDRHKSEKYGWFGNQSDEGVPRGHMPDLLPVAWRLATPRPHLEMVEAFVSSRRNGKENPHA